jgi:uncharacterized cupin superfamily protein
MARASSAAKKKKFSARKGSARNKAAKSSRGAPAKAARSAARVAKSHKGSPRKAKQRVAISHYRDEDFAAGLRSYAKYRDLGIADATNGMVRAHVLRFVEPCDPAVVSKRHYHDTEFQMVYVLKGWVKTELEGQGEVLMREGSAWTQPPKIRHVINDYSDDCELLEVILPADFDTVEV